MNRFSVLQRVRNKIKVERSTTLDIAKNAKIVACCVEIKGENNSLIIADGVYLRDVFIEIIGHNCCITIEKDTIIGHQSYLSAKGESIVLRVGKECMFSRNVKVMTSDGHPLLQNGKVINEAKSITIEDNVWLADNATILKGVVVGQGSVVGINATLTHSIPKGCVAVGNPAKVVKEGIEWKK